MDGIILVNKPAGWTSMDVCAKIRNLSSKKKVGHSGTLDPMATGLLIVFLGSATKSIEKFSNADKGYRGEMILGVRTDTMDAEGKILSLSSQGSDIPLHLMERGRGEVENIFAKYTGHIMQKPPMYSAKKVKGQALYKLARRGIEVKRESCSVTIHSFKLLEIIEPNKICFEVICSKGTYIRVLVSDIGDDLGCGAHLSKLERFYSHPFHLSQALTMDAIIDLAKIGKLDTVIKPVSDFVNA